MDVMAGRKPRGLLSFLSEVRPSNLNVMTYSVHRNGTGLSRESQDIIAPGDYGLYTKGMNTIL